jgi:URI fold toxin 2
MIMSDHGNSLNNANPHHLYKIYDEEEDDTFKFGISDDPIEADGLSKRLRNQVDFLNRAVGWLRFIGVVLIRNISGRKNAKSIEDEHIDQYFAENGRRPRGNPKGGSK